jgi:hypothetical protein
VGARPSGGHHGTCQAPIGSWQEEKTFSPLEREERKTVRPAGQLLPVFRGRRTKPFSLQVLEPSARPGHWLVPSQLPWHREEWQQSCPELIEERPEWTHGGDPGQSPPLRRAGSHRPVPEPLSDRERACQQKQAGAEHTMACHHVYSYTSAPVCVMGLWKDKRWTSNRTPSREGN